MYLVDGYRHLRAVNLTDGSWRQDLVFSRPSYDLQDVTLLKRGQLLYLPLYSPWIGRQTDDVLVVSTRDFSLVANFSLASALPDGLYRTFSPLVAGTDGLLYLPAYNATSGGESAMCILNGAGQFVNWWQAPVPPTGYAVTVDSSSNVYFQTVYSSTSTLYKVSRTGQLLVTLPMLLPEGHSHVQSIAVSPSGRIVLTLINEAALYPFTADGTALTPQPLPTVAWSVNQIEFWTDEALLALDQDSSSVLVLRDGDLIGTVHSDHVVLRGTGSMNWDRSSNTLLLTTYSSYELALQRVDAANGWLIQSYELPDRLAGSGVQDVSVDADGNMWLLIGARFGPWQFTRVLVMNHAGRLRKELQLSNAGCTYSSLLVAVELDRMFLFCRSWSNGHLVVAFTLDGRSLFNVSASSGNALYAYTWDVELNRNPPQLLVLSGSYGGGLLIYDPMTGALQSNITFPPTFWPMAIAVAPDTGDFFLSHVAYWFDDVGHFSYNCSVLQVSQGKLIAEYGGSSRSEPRFMMELGLTDYSALFAVDADDDAILMWMLQQQQDEQRGNSSDASQLQTALSTLWQPQPAQELSAEQRKQLSDHVDKLRDLLQKPQQPRGVNRRQTKAARHQ